MRNFRFVQLSFALQGKNKPLRGVFFYLMIADHSHFFLHFHSNIKHKTQPIENKRLFLGNEVGKFNQQVVFVVAALAREYIKRRCRGHKTGPVL